MEKNIISKRAKNLLPSATLLLDAQVKELQAAGVAVINLTLGEPDFTTPKHIQNAAIKALRQGFTHYTATAGIIGLRQAIAGKFKQDNGIFYQPSEIVVGVGSKQLLYHAFQVLAEKGDEVLIPVPTWSTYVEQVRLAEAKPVLVRLAPPFKLTAADLEKRLSPKTKIILLNTPANPTGAMIEKKELAKIARLAVKRKIFIVSDEIYEKIIYGAKQYSIASFNEEIKKITITINGFSKAYAMTGWRIGYAAGPKEVIEAMVSLQSQTTSNTSSIAQKAAEVALTGTQEPVEKMRKEFQKRRQYLIKELSKIRKLSFTQPEGAFYFFIDIRKLLGKKYQTSGQWTSGLLQETKVAIVPGEAFLYPGYVRLSFTVSMADIREAVIRIKKFVEKYG